MRLGDRLLDGIDCGGAGIGILRIDEAQHLGEILFVSVARRGKIGIVGLEIVVAVRHAEAGLGDRHHIGVGVFRVRLDTVARDAAGGEGGIAHQCGDVARRLRCRDAVEIGLRGREAARFDPRCVGEGVVEIANLLLFGAQARRIARFQPGHQLLHPLLGEDTKLLERADRRAIRRDRRALEPVTVGVFEEVVARLDAAVHAREVEAPGRDSRLRRGGNSDAGGARQCGECDGDLFHVLCPSLVLVLTTPARACWAGGRACRPAGR